MKQIFLLVSLLLSFSLNYLSAQSTSSDWPAHKAKKWFKKKEWLNGLSITPHSSIDKVQFAKQYHLNQAAWDKAFAYLKNTDLKTLANGKHVIDGDKVYATVSEAPTKDYDKTAFESHRKYIDLQYVITGEENMAKAPVTSVTVSKPYDEATDLANYTGEGKIYTVPAGTFMLFFPTDAHRPNITPGGNKVVKKIVIKINVAKES
ncbi:MAG: YhcH/YjgK/YiaL family protein [Flavisolibacter sp.]|nr:YhcH/YjgK/YiaL family protein [Flavisolibacter sp.]